MRLRCALLPNRLSDEDQLRHCDRGGPRMKGFRLAAACLVGAVSSGVGADELVTMSNGMTVWKTDSGYLYGASGGVSIGDSGFNDTRTGERYERINPSQAIDTRTGQAIQLPDGNRSRYNRDQDE